MDFTEIYKNAANEVKLEFLNSLLNKNKHLQKDFVEFWKKTVSVKKKPPKSSSTFFEQVNNYREDYLTEFENIILDQPDWETYCGDSSYYREEWEIIHDEGEEQVEEIMSRFESNAVDLLLLQDIESLIASFTGLYEAGVQAEIEDEYDAYEDINDDLIYEHKNLLQRFAEKIYKMSILDELIIPAIQSFIDYFKKEHSDDQNFLRHFEPLLLSIAEVIEQPDEFLSIINKSKVEPALIPQLIVKLHKLSDNDKDWITSARQLYKVDVEVAKQLLVFYFDNDREEFVKIAKELLINATYDWPDYLKDRISREIDEELYYKVFYALTVKNKKIEYYKKIKDYFNEESFNELKRKLSYNKEFLVDILAVEEKYDAIKQIVEETSDEIWQLNNLIHPILNVYPVFCFGIIKSIVEDMVEKYRGRNYYQLIGSYLKMAKIISGYDEQTGKLIMQIYNHKPNLPALRDELRKGGVV